MMKATVTPEAETAISDIAQRYAISRDAVLAMLFALHNGGGTMAQFSIPELGGSGQWMQGGMTMVGNMFDNALKARVDALCGELSQLLASTSVFPASSAVSHHGFTSANWWPAELGVPSATGAQNEARYAVFPSTRRLAVLINGVTKVFDTGEHRIGGVQQQQGGGYGTVQFTSQFGTFGLPTLTELGAEQVAATPVAAPDPEEHHRHAAQFASQAQGASIAPQFASQMQAQGAGAAPQFASQMQAQTPPPVPAAAPTPAPQPPPPPPAPAAQPSVGGPADPGTIVAAIESLAGLHQRGILSDDEFAAKKAELLARL